MTGAPAPVHQRHLELVEEIETRFAVAGWRSGDVDLWPPARMDLFLDLFRAAGGDTTPRRPGLLRRATAAVRTPLSRALLRDDDGWTHAPIAADAILLGDGVSLDRIDGAWRDRHGEPVMAALERLGQTTFLMQPGGGARRPWARSTFAANGITVRGAWGAAMGPGAALRLPDLAAVRDFLAREQAQAPSLDPTRLVRRAGAIAASAAAFQKVLRAVRPRLAFTVTYYAGLGHAFALACRREGVLSVDLQHCPRDGGHRGYHWPRLPVAGYSTLPAVFWTWSRQEAEHASPSPWHVALHGGHAQLAPYLDDGNAATRAWDVRVAAAAGGGTAAREVLIALQPIGGRRGVWEALARQIETAPPDWRWWIRRHPAAAPFQDAEHQALLALRRPNVIVEAASELPLPALLRRMDIVVSLASGAAAEAAMFGVPALFLDAEARATFPGLLARGAAELIEPAAAAARIAGLPPRAQRPSVDPPPPLRDTLRRLASMALVYRRRCQDQPLAGRDPV